MAKQDETRQQLLDELLDELVEDAKTPEDIVGENGILKQRLIWYSCIDRFQGF